MFQFLKQEELHFFRGVPRITLYENSGIKCQDFSKLRGMKTIKAAVLNVEFCY